MDTSKLLRILKENRGEYVSGEAVSALLGITRGGVWKGIKSLREQGYTISSSTNRGYLLEKSPDVLTEEEIREYMNTQAVGKNLITLPAVPSTNTYLMKLAPEGAPHGTAVVASCQTAGRGRLGRSFFSPQDKGIYLSVLLRPETAASGLMTFTAFTAVAVCEAIERACGVSPGIKWTNDIVLGAKKICGILTEISLEGESGAVGHLVAGVGVNVLSSAEDFPEAVRNVAGSIFSETGKTPSRARLAAEILNGMDRMYAEMFEKREEYLRAYEKRCVTLGREVRILRGNTEKTARAVGLGESAELLVEYPDGSREALSAGEVSVRGLMGYL